MRDSPVAIRRTMNKQTKRYNRMGQKPSPGRPKKAKIKPCKNPDYFAGWEWLFGNGKGIQVISRSEGHKFTKNKNSIYGVLFYCKTCDYTWEQDKSLSHCRGEGIEYYQDFPTRGLERRKCPQCKRRS